MDVKKIVQHKIIDVSYEIIHEDEHSISIRCTDAEGNGSLISRRKQPPKDIVDLEADDIVRCAKKQVKNEY